MVDFKALAEHAATVEVCGEDVKLRPPPVEFRDKVRAFIDAGQDGASKAYLQLTAEALHATVIDDQELTLDHWERLVQLPRDRDDPNFVEVPETFFEDFEKLVLTALRLCGMGWDKPDGTKVDGVTDGVTDRVADADNDLGNSRTK